MVIILVCVSVFIAGIYLGKEMASNRLEEQILELKKEVEFWRETATRKTVSEPPAIDGREL